MRTIHIQEFSKIPFTLIQNHKRARALLVIAILSVCISILFLSGCSHSDNISNEPQIKYAPDDGYQFQQLFENDDLANYDQVEVGIGSLDYIDTSLVYADTSIENIDTQNLKQGIVDASIYVGPHSGKISFYGSAQITAIDESTNTITVSDYGPTLKNALERDQLTIEVGQEWLSRGQALLSDLTIGETVVVEFAMPQDNDPLFGYVWATDLDGNVKLIDHPESYTFPENPFTPSTSITIEEADLTTFDEAHRISGVSVSEVDPTLYEDGILDAFFLDVPKQIVLYCYARVSSVSDKTATFDSLGTNIVNATSLTSVELLIPTRSEHLFDGEATLSQVKPGDTVVLQLVLGYGENTLTSGNIWLVDESGKATTL